jgi:hypothetical protein
MLSLANDLVTRAARLIASGFDSSAVWTISVRERVVGSLVWEAGCWRLTWFEGADPLLANYTGPLDGDVEALGQALTARLGRPVRLDRLSS